MRRTWRRWRPLWRLEAVCRNYRNVTSLTSGTSSMFAAPPQPSLCNENIFNKLHIYIFFNWSIWFNVPIRTVDANCNEIYRSRSRTLWMDLNIISRGILLESGRWKWKSSCKLYNKNYIANSTIAIWYEFAVKNGQICWKGLISPSLLVVMNF